jgi:6-phosphogluconolactonase/glucosamine-6-phosphate isomerase/deaminase
VPLALYLTVVLTACGSDSHIVSISPGSPMVARKFCGALSAGFGAAAECAVLVCAFRGAPTRIIDVNLQSEIARAHLTAGQSGGAPR